MADTEQHLGIFAHISSLFFCFLRLSLSFLVDFRFFCPSIKIPFLSDIAATDDDCFCVSRWNTDVRKRLIGKLVDGYEKTQPGLKKSSNFHNWGNRKLTTVDGIANQAKMALSSNILCPTHEWIYENRVLRLRTKTGRRCFWKIGQIYICTFIIVTFITRTPLHSSHDAQWATLTR